MQPQQTRRSSRATLASYAKRICLANGSGARTHALSCAITAAEDQRCLRTVHCLQTQEPPYHQPPLRRIHAPRHPLTLRRQELFVELDAEAAGRLVHHHSQIQVPPPRRSGQAKQHGIGVLAAHHAVQQRRLQPYNRALRWDDRARKTEPILAKVAKKRIRRTYGVLLKIVRQPLGPYPSAICKIGIAQLSPRLTTEPAGGKTLPTRADGAAAEVLDGSLPFRLRPLGIDIRRRMRKFRLRSRAPVADGAQALSLWRGQMDLPAAHRRDTTIPCSAHQSRPRPARRSVTGQR